MAKVVAAPLVVVKDDAGKHHYLKSGADVPNFVSAADVKILAKRGLIAEGSKAARAQKSPEADKPEGDK